jgi:hypothetical protein
VLVVEKRGFDTCEPEPSDIIKKFQSGIDRITLVKGDNYFICGVPGHCDEMKLAINAL